MDPLDGKRTVTVPRWRLGSGLAMVSRHLAPELLRVVADFLEVLAHLLGCRLVVRDAIKLSRCQGGEIRCRLTN